MEPILDFQGLSLTLVELILAVVLVVVSVLVTLLFARRGTEAFYKHLSDMQGRLSQMNEESSRQTEALRASLDKRLDTVSERVGHSLTQTQERTAHNLRQLHERLALIDRAQKNIETLSGEVSGLQSILAGKQSRGAFGEIQMQDLIRTFLPANAFEFQSTLSNGRRVDALIKLPNPPGDVPVDSKFPLDSFKRLAEAQDDICKTQAARAFRADVLKHVKDIAERYLIVGETSDVALLFLPSEAVYAELHANFGDVIERSFKAKVMIVSPTTFMATLNTMRAVMKDAAMREQAHVIQAEVGKMAEDVTRLDDRVAALQRHFSQAEDDVRKIRISTEKISSRAQKIEDIGVDGPEPDALGESSGRRISGGS